VTGAHADLLARVAGYYSGKFAAHGATAAGVDWNSPESQALRFAELSQLFEPGPFSVIDYGCGYGAFADFLSAHALLNAYQGFDVAADMIADARRRHAAAPACRFVTDSAALEAADYTIASGIFNVRFDISDDDWLAYMVSTLDQMMALSTRGFAFNALTSYSDADRRRADLYYADPRVFFDHCKRRFSKRVSLLHDYALYEFTMLVRL
jgi:predicted TPR repeat methyltransferase